MTTSFDLIVIGSGQGGVPLATTWAGRGKRVVLFERGAFGGTCINAGCTPSKALLASAHLAGRARLGAPLGIHAEVRVDFPAVMARVRAMRSSWSAGVEQRLRSAGVEVVAAEARFVGPRLVEAAGQVYQADTVVINTGGSPIIPPLPGLQAAEVLTSDTVFDLTMLPQTLIIIGGGYIGLELGQGFARLGSQVHVLEPGAHVLSREEPEVGQALQTALQADGVRLHLKTRATQVTGGPSGFKLALSNGQVLDGDAVLVATGRRPNTAALRLEAAGIAVDDQAAVKIDAHFATTCPGVYAIGDVAGQPAFTHVSWEDHRRLLAILDGHVRSRDDRVLGYAVYTDPQVGRVGLTEAQAQARGLNARAVTLPLSHVARALELEQTTGFFRLVVGDDDRILGATLVGPEAAELVHVILALMEAGATWRTLEQSVHIHPALAEGLPSLARLLVETP